MGTSSLLQTLPFSVSYHAVTEPPAADTLALVSYGTEPLPGDDPRQLRVGLDAADAAPILAEHWRSAHAVRHGWDGDFGYAENGAVLFAQVRLPEAALETMEPSAFRIYSRIREFLRRHSYPQLLRTWNYFHDIHRGEGDQERYRQFVAGRYQAFAGTAGFERQLPAATAIGTRSEGMLIYFLAGKTAGVQIENPRQLSAFQYPREYGPRSPSFSRATLLNAGNDAVLLVSGTASIVGHATRHADDAVAQLDEVIRNLQALLLRAREKCTPGSGRPWRADALKLYVRDRALLPALASPLRSQLGAQAPIICLEGDICRRDLLVEIEGVYSLR